MTVHDPETLIRHITQQIALLNEHLITARPQQAARILGRVLDIEEGILGGLTALMATGSRFAQDRAIAGDLPPEVCLALGRAANELHDIGLDLDEHAEDLHRFSQAPAVATVPPVASALVARRHR
ncbi:hypothetical protein [Streptomyces sp. NPDC093225]|uniref:hypothetical protein n=1 Tax=Streptomyces sp. NPDC093225 TaxID=3366034 RepID=UPI00382FBC1F